MRGRALFLLQVWLLLVLADCGSAPQPGAATTAVPPRAADETIITATVAPTETVEAPATVTGAAAASTAAVEAPATITVAIETATATADAGATTTSGSAQTNLEAALAFAPIATSIVQFTDWQLITYVTQLRVK